MKATWKYIKNYKKEVILAPLFKMLEASFELIVPLVMAAVIDHGIRNADKPYVVKMCFVLIALGLIGLVCSITAQYFSAKAATGVASDLRKALFAHIQAFDYSKLDTIGTSTLITRMTSDINQVQSGVNLVLRLFLRSPFIVIGAMVMAFYVDTTAAWTFVVVIPVLSLIVFGVMAITMPLYKKVQGNLDKVLLVTRENLIGSRVIRAFNKEDSERQRFESDNQELTAAQKHVGKISGLMNPLTYVVVNLGLIVLIYVGGMQVDCGKLSQGEVVALVNYMSQILVELIKLANLIISVTKAVACGNRIQNVMDEHSTMADGSDNLTETEPMTISFDHVSLVYDGAGAESLTDINFEAKTGETIGVIGGTGSGKSSLVNLIPRFYDAFSGAVKINGKNVKDYEVKQLREQIGIVPQKAVLFKGTIADNMRWGKEDATQEEMEEALEISQSKEFVASKKDGILTKIEQNGRNLSGGQRQRLTIARALVRKPKILILDDSASALDYATDAKLRGAIRGMKEKPIVFIVSQRASSVQYADQILVLDDGLLVGKGTHDELLKSCEVYQEIYYSQFEKTEQE